MSQQQFTSLTKMSTATWFLGTVWCFFTVNMYWAITVMFIGRGCIRGDVRKLTDLSPCMPKFRTPGHRENVTVQSSCPEAVNQIIKSVRQSSFLWNRFSTDYTCSFYFKIHSSPCRYSYGQFVEINSHSLFSKWFSEVHLAPFFIFNGSGGGCSWTKW